MYCINYSAISLRMRGKPPCTAPGIPFADQFFVILSEHAGVSHFSTTEPGRFPPGALDVVRQGYHEPTSPDLPAYGEIPEIVIATL